MINHVKTFSAIEKLKDVEIELHRLKNALDLANKALEAKQWVGLTDEDYKVLREGVVKQGKPIQWMIENIEAKLKEKNQYDT